MKKLIINADDFGLDDHTVEWTIKGFECGALTSATIMAGMPATEKAVAYAKVHPQFSFGVHFYLVDERPMCAAKDIPSMVNPATGKLWPTRQFILRNFAGLIRVDDLVREMTAQYQAVAASGLKISHVDGHGHNHRLPQSIRALRELEVGRRGGGGQRNWQNGSDLVCQLSPPSTPLKVRRCQDIVVGREGLLGRLINKPMQRRLDAAGFRMTDHFAMNAGHTDDPKWFSKLLEALPEDVTEVGVHPGVDEEWRRIEIEELYGLGDWRGVEKVSFNDI